MMTFEEVRTALGKLRLTLVAKETGLHINTVRGIENGTIPSPSIVTVEKLKAFIEGVGK